MPACLTPTCVSLVGALAMRGLSTTWARGGTSLAPSLLMQKSAAQKLVHQAEQQRDAALAEARRWRQELTAAEDQAHALRGELAAAKTAVPQQLGGEHADVALQLAALQQQLEGLAAEGGLAAPLQQERARMSICLRTIKVRARFLSWRAFTAMRHSQNSPSASPSGCCVAHLAWCPSPSPPFKAGHHRSGAPQLQRHPALQRRLGRHCGAQPAAPQLQPRLR